MCESLPTSPNEQFQFIYPFNFFEKNSFPKFHAAPTDQKLPHLLAAANFEEPSLRTEAEKIYLPS
jgi:hypothetical protein